MKELRIFLSSLFTLVSTLNSTEYVILLHGLCRTKSSMTRMEKSLTSVGYNVVNVGYPSRSKSIRELSGESILPPVQMCQNSKAEKIHFVTHSMGGIMVRDYLSRHTITNLGRIVMLGPPNQGSELVDKLNKLSLFKWVNGPAGQELTTSDHSLPNRLGPVKFPLGVIAGDRTINWINSLMIPGSDDGKVSIKRTRIAGMADHIVVHASHPFIMKNKEAIKYTIAFLKSGSFTDIPK